MMEFSALQMNMPAICELRYNEPLSSHTSFRIGGNAEIMAFPRNPDELRKLLEKSAMLDIKPYILGAGTNVLAPDSGLPGLVICLKDSMDGLEKIDDTHIRVMAGVTMTRSAVFAANQGLSGLEFAHGIPGTVGGGVYMNAGAYGGEMCQVCESIDVMDLNGDIRSLSNNELGFSYRHSILESNDWIVLSVVFSLTPKAPDRIRSTMKELMARRSASQPLDLPSAGSAFKRPDKGYAAVLIDNAGLKGYRVGGAAVSDKHAGFVVNLGGATAADVVQLLQDVSNTVFEKFGVRLDPEMRIW